MKKVAKPTLTVTKRKKIHGRESMSGCGKFSNNQCGINEKSG